MPKLNNDGVKAAYAKYSIYFTMVIKMGVLIGIGVYAGQWLDNHFMNKTPAYTVAGSLIGIATAMYVAIKDILNNAKSN